MASGAWWLKIGYHFVIKRDGTVETGRELEEVGAHAKGQRYPVGICMVGGLSEDNEPGILTADQWSALENLGMTLRSTQMQVVNLMNLIQSLSNF